MAALAVSMTEPPPTETTPSKLPSERNLAASMTETSEGSMRISSNTA